MRLIIEPPPAWQPSGARYIVPGPPAPAELVVEIRPLVVAPEDLIAWRDAALLGDPPPGATPVVVDERSLATGTGWPVVIIRVTLGPEFRVVALYRFLHCVASVRVRSPSGGAIAAREEELLAVLLGARPDFRGDEPAALLELWDPGDDGAL